MKRPVVTALFLCAAAALPGCPIYDHQDGGCYRNSDCASGYVCDDNTGECYLPGIPPSDSSCNKPGDCGVNETCSKLRQCVSGDCTFSGCVSGYSCDSSSGTWECVPSSSAGAAGAGGMSGAAGAPAAGAGGDSGAGQAGATP